MNDVALDGNTIPTLFALRLPPFPLPFVSLSLRTYFGFVAVTVSDEIYGCPNLAACVGGYDEASYCDDAFEGPRESFTFHPYFQLREILLDTLVKFVGLFLFCCPNVLHMPL